MSAARKRADLAGSYAEIADIVRRSGFPPEKNEGCPDGVVGAVWDLAHHFLRVTGENMRLRGELEELRREKRTLSLVPKEGVEVRTSPRLKAVEAPTSAPPRVTREAA
jgi:hypothetical protein